LTRFSIFRAFTVAQSSEWKPVFKTALTIRYWKNHHKVKKPFEITFNPLGYSPFDCTIDPTYWFHLLGLYKGFFEGITSVEDLMSTKALKLTIKVRFIGACDHHETC
jgi:hypothetical protein